MDKKLILVIAAYVAVPAFLAWVGYIFGHGQIETVQHEAVLPHTDSKTGFYELPGISYSQVPAAGPTSHIKLSLSIEVNKNDLSRVADYQPIIMESIITCLHGRCFDDAQEKGALKQLREDIVNQINAAALPFKVVGVAISRLILD